MLDAYIIDKMKQEKQDRESAWEPLPLEMPVPEQQEDDQGERDATKKEPKEPKRGIVQIEYGR